jgi:hypothetical protein
MTYIKEMHGGTYRRVALSGLLDSLQKLTRQKVERERGTKHKSNMAIRYTIIQGIQILFNQVAHMYYSNIQLVAIAFTNKCW